MPQQQPSTASVVLPTRGRQALLDRTLPPLLQQSAAAEVIVVTDGDATSAQHVRTAYPVVRVVELPHAQGRMAARQAGADAASGDVVVLLDDDVLASPALIEGHLRAHIEQPGAVVVGHMPVDRNPAATLATRIYAEEYDRRVQRYRTDASDVLAHLWGGNLSLRASDLQRVGLLSEGFASLPHEDTDFGLRCKAAGLRGVFDPRIEAVHLHQRSVQQMLAAAYEHGRARALLARRHPSAVLPASASANLLHFGARGLVAREWRSEIVARIARRAFHAKGMHDMERELRGKATCE